MPSSRKTPNLGLNLWDGTDKPKRADFNSDNSIIDAAAAKMSSGTWTPTITSATLTNISAATWKKNGTHVQAVFTADILKGDTSSPINFGGLPFAASQYGTCILWSTDLIFNTDYIPLPGYVSGTIGRISVYRISNGRMFNLSQANIASDTPQQIRVTFEYEAVS